MMKIESMEWKKHLCEGAAAMGIHLTSHDAELIFIHAHELAAWNRKMNLTAIRDPLEIAVKHYLDSLACIPYLPKTGRILDMGTGGGFPGIPIKILVPALNVTLVDSTQKKITFIKHVVRLLKLGGIEALHTRVESLPAEKAASAVFDVVICRALFSLEDLLEKSLPLLAGKGMIISWKAKLSADEIRNIQVKAISRGFEFQIKPYALPFLNLNRVLVLLIR
jgi:16S rRNA (guanine527-N7)-methyltransferase